MRCGIILSFFAILLISTSYAGKLPADFQLCKHDDPNFSECMKNAIQSAFSKLDDGIPSLNVPSLNPLNIPSVTIGEGKGSVNVVQNYKNLNIYGFNTVKIKTLDAKITDNDLTMQAEMDIPEARFEAEYILDGRILLLPVHGNGKCTINLHELNTKWTLNAEAFDKKGKKYLKVKDISLTLTPKKVVYNFENLFNGDERLGTEMNRLLNDNWKEVYDDVKEQYQTALQTVFIDYCNKVYTKVPYEDLF